MEEFSRILDENQMRFKIVLEWGRENPNVKNCIIMSAGIIDQGPYPLLSALPSRFVQNSVEV